MAVLVLVQAVAGCYRYAPIDVQDTTLGTEVRARLTDAGALTLAPLIGNRVELVDGRITSVADSAVSLSVTATTDRLGTETPWRGENVVIARSMLAGFERRTLDRKRSYLIGGISLGVVAAVGVGFGVTGSGDSGRGGATSTPK